MSRRNALIRNPPGGRRKLRDTLPRALHQADGDVHDVGAREARRTFRLRRDGNNCSRQPSPPLWRRSRHGAANLDAPVRAEDQALPFAVVHMPSRESPHPAWRVELETEARQAQLPEAIR